MAHIPSRRAANDRVSPLLPWAGLLGLVALFGPLADGAARPGPLQVEQVDAAPTARVESAADLWRPAAPTETYRVTDVVDGDTIRIQFRGKSESLRLLSVDTEEKLSPRPRTEGSKPETLFGEATRVWARQFFEERAKVGEELRVGLLFPGGSEARDVYGRLLCHVLLPDGTDFNLLLVREGKSPYFTKYGYSQLCHDAFAAAQWEARAAQRGMWHPDVNRPEREQDPWIRRPYERLLPWWDASARAIENFENRRKGAEGEVLSGEDADGLEAALQVAREVEVHGSVFRVFEESDGSLSLLLRSPEPQRAVRVLVPRAMRAELLPLALETRADEFVQNHLVVRGVVESGPRGMGIRLRSKADLKLGGPEVQDVGDGLPRPRETSPIEPG